MTKIESLALIARSNFREFDKCDWMAFGGCVSVNPLGSIDVSIHSAVSA
jgi:hypothetical protein